MNVVTLITAFSRALYGVITTPADFATHMLAIIIMNLMSYCLFYICMKVMITVHHYNCKLKLGGKSEPIFSWLKVLAVMKIIITIWQYIVVFYTLYSQKIILLASWLPMTTQCITTGQALLHITCRLMTLLFQIVHKEGVPIQCIVLAIVGAIFWGSALWFFTHVVTNWQVCLENHF